MLGTCQFKNLIFLLGYGYHHPTDDEGRLFTIFYIFVGVYFIFLFVADSVIHMMTLVTNYVKTKFGKADIATEYKYLNRLIYLNVVAIVATLLIGAGCLTGLEGWSFIKALYFVVETSTVRFIDWLGAFLTFFLFKHVDCWLW